MQDKKSKISWLFTRRVMNQVQNDDMTANHFTNTDVLNAPIILVRESIQNGIDARDKSAGIATSRMRFYLGSVDASIANRYFSELKPRLEKCLKVLPDLTKACEFVVVEDFDTTGLEGTTMNNLPEKDPRNGSFVFFSWASGKSNKKEETGGKNGVGKIVFNKISGIKTYLVFSVRDIKNVDADEENLLFGKTILKNHEYDNEQWLKEGHWMVEAETGHHVPSNDLSEIATFREDWSIKREAGEKGTSIVVPYRDPKITDHHILQAVVQDYFVAILEDKVTVEIESEKFEIVLNSMSIRQNLEELDESLLTKNSKSKKDLLTLCDMYLSRKAKETLVIEIASAKKNRNRWDEIIDVGSMRDEARIALENGVVVEFKVKTTVPRIIAMDGRPEVLESEDSFSVLVKKVDKANTYPVFCREGILIPSAGTQKIDGYLTLVLIDSGRLGDFLGDAEGPSHEKWSPDEEKFAGKYIPDYAGAETITFVRQSVHKAIGLVQLRVNEIDESKYANVFPLPENGDRDDDQSGSDGTTSQVRPKSKGNRSKKGKQREVRTSLIGENFQVTQLENGFFVEGSEDNSLKPGDKVDIKVGYDVSVGNPLKFSDVDFSVRDLIIRKRSQGYKVETASGNHLTIQIESPDFRLEAAGFDPYRDLVVAVYDVN
jgi:hypothetical protein